MSLFEQALDLQRRGRSEDARVLYERVLAENPRHVQALTFLAVIAFEKGDAQLALMLSRRTTELDPVSPAAHLIQGHANRALRRPREACECYGRALSLNPNLASAHLYAGIGLSLLELRDYSNALAIFDRAIALSPHDPVLHYNRGCTLKALGRLEAALASFGRSIECDPQYADAHLNHGNALNALGRTAEAIASFDRAIAINPGYADAHCNRGVALAERMDLQAARTSFDRAIELDPEHAHARFSRSFVTLAVGDFDTGWRDFDWRLRTEHCVTIRERRSFPEPVWSGRETLTGKSILVYCEQGLGDTIQFCRYLRLLAERGARVIFESPQELVGLFCGLEGVDELVVRGGKIPRFDCHCSLMSLPLAFNTTLATLPAKIPYLRPNSTKASGWRERLAPADRLRVGLVWSGGFRPDQPEVWAVNARRNIPLTALAPLANSDVEFVSLQKGAAAEAELQRATASGWDGPQIANYASELQDFSDTAALVDCLDLVISVDTSTAHLAGALGKPVWIMNRFDSCWRWMLDRDDSPWYPTATLYRQEKAGDWAGVIDKIRSDLTVYAIRKRQGCDGGAARVPSHQCRAPT